jgi:hypothetical protein
MFVWNLKMVIPWRANAKEKERNCYCTASAGNEGGFALLDFEKKKSSSEIGRTRDDFRGFKFPSAFVLASGVTFIKISSLPFGFVCRWELFFPRTLLVIRSIGARILRRSGFSLILSLWDCLSKRRERYRFAARVTGTREHCAYLSWATVPRAIKLCDYAQ